MNAARDYRFEYKRVLDSLSGDEEREDFHALLLLSLALYESYHLSFYWTKQLKENLADRDTSQLKQLKNSLSHNDHFSFAGREFQAGRLKGVFELYFEKDAEKSRQRKDTVLPLTLAAAFLGSRIR